MPDSHVQPEAAQRVPLGGHASSIRVPRDRLRAAAAWIAAGLQAGGQAGESGGEGTGYGGDVTLIGGDERRRGIAREVTREGEHGWMLAGHRAMVCPTPSFLKGSLPAITWKWR